MTNKTATKSDTAEFFKITELAGHLLHRANTGNLEDDIEYAFACLMNVATRRSIVEAKARGDNHWSTFTGIDPVLRVLIDQCGENPTVLKERINRIVEQEGAA